MSGYKIGKADRQLSEYAKNHNPNTNRAVNNSGTPVPSLNASLTVGRRGYIVLQDVSLLVSLTSLARERIPERVINAKGAGAFGYFEVTNDITKYCKARLFEKVGKQTDIAVRFASTIGETGSSDSNRDSRGFSIKFYTDDGNWDLVGLNFPVFPVRNPILFPSLIHAQRKNPKTHARDPDMYWDFMSLRPETIHQMTLFYTDRGIPTDYRHMNGYGVNTYKLISRKNEVFYCKFHMKPDQGIKNLTPEKAAELDGTDGDSFGRDLYNAIEDGDFPSWKLYIQVMTMEQAEKCRYDPFDATKVWLHAEYPLMEVGKFCLTKTPTDYFNNVEQITFGAGNMPPGIEVSPDPILQARLFAYGDSQRYRVGTNHEQLKVNRPKFDPFTYNRDGNMNLHNYLDGAPNYFPNTFNGPYEDPKAIQLPYFVSGDVDRYDTGDDDNFTQANLFYMKVLNEEKRTSLAKNIAAYLKFASETIRERALKNFYKVNTDYGDRVRKAVDEALRQDAKETY